MEVLEKINILYTQSLKEQFYEADYQIFQKLVSDYKIDEMMKVRRKSRKWFYSFSQPSKPYFITLQKHQEFSKVTKVLLNIFEKLTNAYYNNIDIKNILLVNGKVRNYIGVNPGYARKLPIARLDAYYNFSTGALHFLEINTDIPGGMGDNDMLIKIFDCLPSMHFLQNQFEIKRDTLVNSLYKVLLKKYQEYCRNFKKTEKENPHIAIVCARNSDLRLEVDFIIVLLKKEGFKVSYGDPRDFVYDGKTLMLNGEEVDIINRRENIRDIFRTDSIGKLHSNIRNKVLSYSKTVCLNNQFLNAYLKRGYFGHTEDLLKAYSENNVCMVNPFFSSISVQKSAFALIQDNRFKNLFDEEELHIINKYIPWTRILKEGKTFYDNKEIDLLQFIKTNKQKFVLKPNYGFGGKGVVIGSETDQSDWEKKINLIVDSRIKYVVQEYIDIPTEDFPVYENGLLKGFSPQYVNINFWGVDGEFAGGLIRASDKKVINVAKGGRFVPVYYVLN
jgi:hypothetical protein